MGKACFLLLAILLAVSRASTPSQGPGGIGISLDISAPEALPARAFPQKATPTPPPRSDALRSIPGAECLPPDRPVEAARLARVIDGDTIEVRLGGRRAVVRYIGVNAPERGQPLYAGATAANRRLVAGGPLYLVRDVSETDRHGRLLRYVIAGQTFVNLALAREGFAQAMTVPPDVSCAEAFRAAEAEARQAGRGLWGGLAPTPSGKCHPAYPTVCLPPPPPDLSCKDIPYRKFPVDHRYGDPHGLDGNRDGIACER